MSAPPPTSPVTAAIIGTGAIATSHIEALQAMAPGVEVIAAVDMDGTRAAQFATTWGLPLGTDDVSAALKADVVHICTPPASHLALVTQALEAGCDVVLEKPPALSLQEMDQLAAAEQRTGRYMATIFQHRFGPATQRLRAMLASGALGRPLVAQAVTCWYRTQDYFDAPWRGKWSTEGGGPTMTLGIHQFDMLLSLLGPWTDVVAMADRLARRTQTEDISTALVRFESGAMATVMNSALSPRETSYVRIDTDKASLEVEHLYGYTDADWRVTPAPGYEEELAGWNPHPSTERSRHPIQFALIYDALAKREEPPVSVASARSTLELAAAIYCSAATGRHVRAGEIDASSPFYASMGGDGTFLA